MTRPILVADSLEHDTTQLVSAALSVVRADTPIHLVHVLDEAEVRDRIEEVPKEEAYLDRVVARIQDQIRSRLERVEHEAALRMEVHIGRGNPPFVILETATKLEATAIVVGVRNRSRVGKLLLGSTSQYVLLNARRPVLAIPTG